MNAQIYSDLEDNQQVQFIAHRSILMYGTLYQMLRVRCYLDH